MTSKKIDWYVLSPSDFEGKGWEKTEAPFDRLPLRAKKALPTVWGNSHSSTGMCAFFNTNSTSIRAKWTLGSDQLGEQNFNVCSHSGVDLYCYDPKRKSWRWGGATPHFMVKDKKPEVTLIDGLPAKKRRWRMYMPLRNQVLKIAVGVDAGSDFKVVAPRRKAPLVYYGTSIIHGAFAIRSGLGVAQILARKLDMPLINLGFSGAAKMEKEMAELLAELKAGVFIIDPYHNLSAETIENNAERFIDILCSARPRTPTFVLGAPQYLLSWLKPEMQKEQDAKTLLFGRICRKMARKYPNLHYLKGDNFYGSEEVSMDGVHPNDEAFACMADILEKKISRVLG